MIAMMLSGGILVYNEAPIIRRALESLWRTCDEVIAFDGFSTDGTRSILDAYGCKVCEHEFDNHRNQKNRVMEKCSHDWVLLLDADEYLNNKLADSIQALAQEAESKGHDAVGFPRLNLLDGIPTGAWPDVQTRLLRNHVRFGGHPFHAPPLAANAMILAGQDRLIIHDKTRERQERQNRLYYYMRPGDYSSKPPGAEDVSPPKENFEDRQDLNTYAEYLQKFSQSS